MTTMNSTSGQLWAGVAKVDITAPAAAASDDPLGARIDPSTNDDRLYAKALVLKSVTVTVVIVTLDAVAIAEIGTIGNDYLALVRGRLHENLGLDPQNVLINVSHCHGSVCEDIEARTVRAVEEAWQNLVPVSVGVGRKCRKCSG